MRVLCEFFPFVGRANVVVLIDNNASLCSIVRAYSKCVVGLSVVSDFWYAVDSALITPWVERIPSDLNLADRPSRDPSGARSIPFNWAWPAFLSLPPY